MFTRHFKACIDWHVDVGRRHNTVNQSWEFHAKIVAKTRTVFILIVFRCSRQFKIEFYVRHLNPFTYNSAIFVGFRNNFGKRFLNTAFLLVNIQICIHFYALTWREKVTFKLDFFLRRFDFDAQKWLSFQIRLLIKDQCEFGRWPEKKMFATKLKCQDQGLFCLWRVYVRRFFYFFFRRHFLVKT